ncbi:MAG: N-acetylmuramoyl-L-alanine amidase [Firmicutes bacterium]|nr:N-acetylmuramoyl-L-alanine amidase [Bacillota bacterium]
MKICIDPGHGGKDPGAVAAGCVEKDVALSISLKLAEILKSKGLDVFLTRSDDTYNSVAQKAAKANKWGADLFVSIHCNSAASASANGTECLIYAHDGESDKLAEHIQNSIVQNLKTADRHIKIRKDLTVLNSTNMPAVLVETAFVSNGRREGAQTMKMDFCESKIAEMSDREKLMNCQNEFALAVAKGVFEHLGFEEEIVEKSSIFVDEKEFEVERILKDGTNYIKIRDIAELLGYRVESKGNIAVLKKI